MSQHGTHSYQNISRTKVEAIIKALMSHGSIVTGCNPWAIDTKKHGVLLRGDWNEETSTLNITVTGADWHVPGITLWEKIDSLMNKAQHKG